MPGMQRSTFEFVKGLAVSRARAWRMWDLKPLPGGAFFVFLVYVDGLLSNQFVVVVFDARFEYFCVLMC